VLLLLGFDAERVLGHFASSVGSSREKVLIDSLLSDELTHGLVRDWFTQDHYPLITLFRFRHARMII
jgi:hypothetical protein